MIKKILILSYYAPPLNGVSSYRVKSFLDYFPEKNLQVTLISRSWKESFTNWNELLSKNNEEFSQKIDKKGNTIYYLPFKSTAIKSKFKILNKLQYFMKWISGYLQPEVDFYRYKNFCFQLLEKEKFDYVLATVPPNNIIRLVYELNLAFKTPYILDFRDYFNSITLVKNQKTSIKDYFLFQLSKIYLKKWVKNCYLAVSVSPRLNNILEKDLGLKPYLVTNGFDNELLNHTKIKKSKKFTLRYIGSAYNHQDFSLIIEGINYLLETGRTKVVFEVVGTMNQKVETLLQKSIPSENIKIYSNRLPQNKIFMLLKNSDVLVLPWNEFDGVYGTKFFDYLGSGSFILSAPSDKGVVEELVTKLQVGANCNNKEEVMNELISLYDNWEKGINNKNNASVEEYSRKSLAYYFADLITENKDEKTIK